jgi:hypothetical protein
VRQYDAESGRFASPDPFKGYLSDPLSQNPYMYCRGNPIKYADPSGYTLVYKNAECKQYVERLSTLSPKLKKLYDTLDAPGIVVSVSLGDAFEDPVNMQDRKPGTTDPSGAVIRVVIDKTYIENELAVLPSELRPTMEQRLLYSYGHELGHAYESVTKGICTAADLSESFAHNWEDEARTAQGLLTRNEFEGALWKWHHDRGLQKEYEDMKNYLRNMP